MCEKVVKHVPQSWPRVARISMAACCRPPPHSACPPVLLDQPDQLNVLLFRKTPPFSSTSGGVIEQAQHARPGTGGTATAQTMEELVADIRATKGSHMPAEIQRYTPPQSARIILFCYTPHTRPSAASSATTALTINFTNHRVLSRRSLIYPYTVAERVRPPFCASL